MSPVHDPATLSAPRLKEALAYWQGKRVGRAMPRRRDIDPVEIPMLLPYVMLIDVLPQPLDFRYRLIGTEIRSISRGDYTGKRFSEFPGKGKGSVLWGLCEEVIRRQAPVSGSLPYIGPEQHLRNCENVLLPLSEDGRDVTMIFKVISFERSRPKLGRSD